MVAKQPEDLLLDMNALEPTNGLANI